MTEPISVVVFAGREALGHEVQSLLAHVGCRATVYVGPQPDVRHVLERALPAAALFDLSSLTDALDAAELRELHDDLDIAFIGILEEAASTEKLRLARQASMCTVLVLPVHAAQVHAALELHVPSAALRSEALLPRPTGRSGTYAIGGERGQLDGARLQTLSMREREIYEHLVRGCGITELSQLLQISPHTVRQHRKSVFRKLAVHSQVELMRHYGIATAVGDGTGTE